MRSRRASFIVVALAVGQAAGGDLEYVERSSGLGTPVMEGGGTEIELGDVNGDGHVDLVSIGDHGSPFINSAQHGVMVWFGNGAGAWNVVQVGDFGYGGVALGDVNHDGLMDVAYGMHHDYSATDLGDQLLEVALGDGTGTAWAPWDDGLASSGETWGMFGTDLADVDNDGDLDVGSISFGCCAGVHVYANQSDGTWAQSFGFLGGNSSRDFVFGDVNGDGLADFAVSHGSGTVYLGDGAGGFALADANLGGGPWRQGVSLGDVNGDGRDDLSFAGGGGVQVWTRGPGGAWQDLSGILAAAGAFELTWIADMNLDGHGDVVALSEDEVRVWAGDGAGGWTAAATIAVASCDTVALRAGPDADHNGFPDIVVITEENCDPWTGGTNRPRFYAEASVPESLSVHPVWPRGGETLLAGSVRFVDWCAAVPAGDGPAAMTIELSLAGPGGPWTTVASSLADNGRYQWHLAADLPSSSDAALRLTLEGAAGSAVALTPAPFTVVGSGGPSADLDGDGDVDVDDLVALILAWGPCPGGCPADLNGDDRVNVDDLVLLILAWG